MDIIKNFNEKELTLSIQGRINTITSKDLDDAINEEMGNFDSLILDLSELEYISSAGLRVLVTTQKKLKPDNIPFVIKNVNDAVGEIFRMSGFYKIFKIE